MTNAVYRRLRERLDQYAVGLCVNSCPEQALGLEQRREDSMVAPPRRGNFMRPSSEIEASIIETG